MDAVNAFAPSQQFVIWGLRSGRHTHRYIHMSFYKSLCQNGFNAVWLDDEPSSLSRVSEDAICWAFGDASKHLPVHPGLSFVSHNLGEELSSKISNVGRRHLKIQVWTAKHSGCQVGDLHAVAFDSKSRTLFQPWGTPWEPSEWRVPRMTRPRRSPFEFWVGSIWNNASNQGNKAIIQSWKKVLRDRDVKFVEMPRGWPNSKQFYFPAVRASAFGASVVGEWQALNQYVPCRVFKNLSAGVVPSGNNPVYKAIFGEYALVCDDLEDLIEQYSRLSLSDRYEMVRGAQGIMTSYTYKAAIERILRLLVQPT